jgi:hypothetical protein
MASDDYPKTEDISLPCPVCLVSVDFSVFYLTEEIVVAPFTVECVTCETELLNDSEERLIPAEYFDDIDDEVH